MDISLPEDLQRYLESKANEAGIAPSQLLVQMVRQVKQQENEPTPNREDEEETKRQRTAYCRLLEEMKQDANEVDRKDEQARRLDEIDRKLLQEGFIRHIPDPSAPLPSGDWKPIKIKGKPLSETVIEDRR